MENHEQHVSCRRRCTDGVEFVRISQGTALAETHVKEDNQEKSYGARD
jgi:hypothetical protein